MVLSPVASTFISQYITIVCAMSSSWLMIVGGQVMSGHNINSNDDFSGKGIIFEITVIQRGVKEGKKVPNGEGHGGVPRHLKTGSGPRGPVPIMELSIFSEHTTGFLGLMELRGEAACCPASSK